MCAVCFWEDGGQDEHDVDTVRGGPNGRLSLARARRNFKAFGVSEQRRLAQVRDPLHKNARSTGSSQLPGVGSDVRRGGERSAVDPSRCKARSSRISSRRGAVGQSRLRISSS
ncbi:hypothetical protein IU479_31525 [Nocardia abscessus]|nr:hypothetical protein [Nocardia abscessus]